MKPKILITTFEPKLSGQGRCVIDLLRYLRNHSPYEPVLICQPSNIGLIKAIEELQIKVYPLRLSKLINFDLLKAHGIIAREKIKLLHAHGMESLIWTHTLAIMAHLPLIFHPHTIDMKNQIFFAIFKHFWRLLAKFCRFTIVVSHKDVETLCKRRIARTEQIRMIYYSIDTVAKSMEQDIRQLHRVKSQQIIVTQIGRICEQKDPYTLVKLAQTVGRERPDIVFMMVGGGNMATEIESFCRQKNVNNIIFTGHVDNIHDYYHATDLMLLTSLWEGLPYTLLDALRYAKTGIATDVNGNGEIFVHNKTGYLFKTQNVEMCKQYLYKLIDNKILRDDFVCAGKKLLQDKFAGNKMGEKIVQLYREILN